MTRSALSLIALLFLPACVSGTPVSTTAAPGAQDTNPQEAGRIFAAMCINTLPDYAGAAEAAAAFPLTQSASTGTYFHNSQNLSFKLTGDSCSMVAGTASSDPVAFIVDTMRSASDAATYLDADVTIGERMGPDGKFYLTARTTASN